MKREYVPEILLKSDETQLQKCAHNWVKIETGIGCALKCEICGQIIDGKD